MLLVTHIKPMIYCYDKEILMSASLTWGRDLKVLSLVDICASWPGVKRWYKCRELSLEDKLVVPGAAPSTPHVHLFFLL